MRIAVVTGKFPIISETFIINQITGLIERGCEVDIFAGKRSKDSVIHKDVEEYDLISRIHYRYNLRESLTQILKLRLSDIQYLLRSLNLFKYGIDALTFRLFFAALSFAGRRSYDIIYCHFGTKGRLAALLKEIGAISGHIVTVFHGYDISGHLINKGPDVYRKLFEIGDLFLPVSTFWKERLVELGCIESKIKVHRMGIEPDRFSTDRDSKDNMCNILSVGRLVEKKGFKYGIKAINILTERFPDLYYRITGDGPLRKELHKLIKDYGLSENIELTGWKSREEIQELMKSTDIFLAPSMKAANDDMEGVPVVIMEAMASCIPVVSTWHSGIPELVKDEISGFLVTEKDFEGLSEKIEVLINNPSLREEMGMKGRKIVEADFNINKLNDRLIILFEGLLFELRPE